MREQERLGSVTPITATERTSLHDVEDDDIGSRMKREKNARKQLKGQRETAP